MERFFKQWRRQGSRRSALDEWFESIRKRYLEDTFVYSQFLQLPVARGAIKYIVRFENGIKSRSIEKAMFVIIFPKSLRYQIRMGILVLDLTDGTFHYYGPLVNNFVRHHVSNFARFLTTLNVRGLNNYKDIRLTYYFEQQILFPRMVNLGGPVTAYFLRLHLLKDIVTFPDTEEELWDDFYNFLEKEALDMKLGYVCNFDKSRMPYRIR